MKPPAPACSSVVAVMLPARSMPAAPCGLDALVISIRGAAGIGDLRQRPTGGAQHDHGSVYVPRRADGGIDQHRGGGINLDRLLIQQVARHIEVVDHHVAEQPAGAGDVGERRRRRIAAGDREQLQPPDLTGPQPVVEGAGARSKRRLKPTISLMLARATTSRHPRTRAALRSNRFFAEYRLAGGGGAFDQVGMGGRGRADHHRIGGEGCVQLDRRRAARGGEAFRGRAVHIHHARQPRPLVRGNVVGVDLPDPPGAEHGD